MFFNRLYFIPYYYIVLYLRKINRKIMADNYLENQYENYLARKAAMGKKTTKKKNIIKVQRLQPEAIEA